MADAADLKSDVERREGSNPSRGTYYINETERHIHMKAISDWLKNHKDSKVKIEITFIEETYEVSSSVVISMTFQAITEWDKDDSYLHISKTPVVTKFKALKQLTDEDLYDVLENLYNKGLASIADMKKTISGYTSMINLL